MTEDPYKTDDSDIKRYRQAEEKLRESEKKYRFLFENSPSAIVLIDNTGKIIDVNPATERMIGFKRGELIGKKYANLKIVLPKYLPKLLERLKKIIKGEILPSIDVKLKGKMDVCCG